MMVGWIYDAMESLFHLLMIATDQSGPFAALRPSKSSTPAHSH